VQSGTFPVVMGGWPRSFGFVVSDELSEREAQMSEFFTSWWFIGIMAVLCVGLIALLLFLRKQGSD
jgi:hypothetical protein